jgi:hypothetical protein
MRDKRIPLPHQKRVVDELAELLKKSAKLDEFLQTNTFEAMELQEQMLLAQQQRAMWAYADILNDRIVYWGVEI